MDSDHDYLRLRLAKVVGEKQNPNPQLSYAGNHRGSRETRQERMAELNREERVLRYLLAQTHEGQVTLFLQRWQRDLSTRFATHKQQHKAKYDALDQWFGLPWSKKQSMPKPPYPPDAEFVDQAGSRWIITERLLVVMKDVEQRLEQFLDFSE